MASTVAPVVVAAHLSRLETVGFSPAKANLNRVDGRRKVGRALERAIEALGLTHKEAAALVPCDPAQLCRWIAGTEPIPMDRIYGTRLLGPFAIEQARDSSECVVETTVTYRRTA
jgi:hypothetical protein